MRRWLIVVMFIAVSCGSSGGGPKVDPYDVYLANKPAGEPTISREDAQARALLACAMDVDWAPGTVDRILVDAYGCR